MIHEVSGICKSHAVNIAYPAVYLHDRGRQCNMGQCDTKTMTPNTKMMFLQQHVHLQGGKLKPHGGTLAHNAMTRVGEKAGTKVYMLY